VPGLVEEGISEWSFSRFPLVDLKEVSFLDRLLSLVRGMWREGCGWKDISREIEAQLGVRLTKERLRALVR